MGFDTGSRPEPAGSGGSGGGEFNLSDPVNSFVRTGRSLVLEPTMFFREMPRNAGLMNPLAFAVISSLISAAPATLLVLAFRFSPSAS